MKRAEVLCSSSSRPHGGDPLQPVFISLAAMHTSTIPSSSLPVFPPQFPSLNLPHLCFFNLLHLITSTHPVTLSLALSLSFFLCCQMLLGLCATFVRTMIKFCSLSTALYAEWGKAVENGFWKDNLRAWGGLQCRLAPRRPHSLLAASTLDDAVGLLDWWLIDKARVLGVARLQDVSFLLVGGGWQRKEKKVEGGKWKSTWDNMFGWMTGRECACTISLLHLRFFSLWSCFSWPHIQGKKRIWCLCTERMMRFSEAEAL